MMLKIQYRKYQFPNGWYVLSEGTGNYWYIGLIIDQELIRVKKIGKVTGKGYNYFDKSVRVCKERNEKDGYNTTQQLI